MKTFTIIITLCALSLHVETVQISLDGTWTVVNGNGTYKASATVPGGIYTDLTAAGILKEDIYYRFNDLAYRWVSMEDWTYNKTFEVSEDLLKLQEVLLVFHGVDTVASVYLNGQHIGDCDNMFVRYTFSVKSFIQIGVNSLEVKIRSPITAAKERFDIQAKEYTVPPTCVPDEYNGECHVNFLRKMQASFAWDWGPAFPSAGIWKSVTLEAFNLAVIRDVMVKTVKSTDKWTLTLTILLQGALHDSEIVGSLSATLMLGTDPLTIKYNGNYLTQTPGDFTTYLVMEIPATQIELWWPNGYGNQKLYTLNVVFTDTLNKNSSKSLKVGFRSVELVQEPMSIGTGLTFYFKINNVPVFAKGSNWIPSHILPEKSSEPATLEHLLESAKLANMNMLRVWGGGLYESDLFYELADEKGLLIWQDFMFACSMYPVYNDFLKSVSIEIKQQVNRLQHHASIAVWAGNNENEAALRNNWYGTSSDFERYKDDYTKLYIDTIRKVTKEQDDLTPFVTSSPSNGLESEDEEYIAKNPYDSHYGDTHYYNYIQNGWDPNTVPSTRFSSEYGYQSIPSLSSMKTISDPSDWSTDSDFSNHREHHPSGYNEMKYEIGLNLQVPDNFSGLQEFTTFIYFSQINQAMSYKTETEFYRRGRSVLMEDGQGLTMGALYWQLNDIWQAPSWASIEFNGKWKMVHYFAKDFFAPVLVSSFVTKEGILEVHLISDELQDLEAQLTVYVYQWNSLSPSYTISSNHTVKNASVTNVLQHNLLEFLQTAECGEADPYMNCFLYFTLTSTDGRDISPHNFLFPQPLKNLTDFTAPTITIVSIKLVPATENVFQIQLETDGVAVFVWLEAGDFLGYFSSNGFLMVSPTKSIDFIAQENITVEQLQEALTVVSLADYY